MEKYLRVGVFCRRQSMKVQSNNYSALRMRKSGVVFSVVSVCHSVSQSVSK